MKDNETNGEVARMEKSQEYITSDTVPDDYLTSGGIASKYFNIFCYPVTGKFSNFMQIYTINYLSKSFLVQTFS